MTKIQKGGFLGLNRLFGDSYGYGYGYGYVPNYTMESGINSGVIQYLYYFILLTIITLLFLVVVHYTIYPIFITRAGQKGFIPVPGGDDSTVYWKNLKETPVTIDGTATPLGSNFQNWSFLLDFQIDSPTANTGQPRILFSRGDELVPFTGTYSEADTIRTVNPNFNVCVYLDKLTNDLYVAVLTTNTPAGGQEQVSIETVQIPNIPVRKPVRLGCMVGSKVLEVYINGKLFKSKVFNNPIRTSGNKLQPPFGTLLANTLQVANLRLWNRPISPAEFRSFGPAVQFELKEIPDSCVA